MTRTTAGIVKVLDDLGISYTKFQKPFRLRRTYAGRHQLAGGTLSWTLEDERRRVVCAGRATATDIIKKHRSGLVETYRYAGITNLCCNEY